MNSSLLRMLGISLLLLTQLQCVKRKVDTDLEVAKRHFENKSFELAISELKNLAAKGEPEAQYMLGYMYFYGQGVDPDREQAYLWFEKAAAKNHRSSQIALSTVYADRANFKKSLKSAKETQITKNKSSFSSTSISSEAKISSVTKQERNIKQIQSKSAMSNKGIPLYGIQIIGLRDITIIKQIIKDFNIEGTSHYYQTTLNDEPWFILVVGEYASMHEAKNALSSMPAPLKQWGAFIKSYAELSKQQSNRMVG